MARTLHSTRAMQFATFLDPAAFAIVGGGTVLATVLRTPARDLRCAVAALRALARPRFIAEPLLHQLAAQAKLVGRHGVMQLDRAVIRDPEGLEALILAEA